MSNVLPQNFTLSKKEGSFYKVEDILKESNYQLPTENKLAIEKFDILYRSLCAILYNFAQTGHPGGSISSGRIAQNLLFNIMLYDFANPDENSADLISYAAGHKALGLYALWALRDELVSNYEPDILAPQNRRLRLEDLLGFRKSIANQDTLFKQLNAKSLDGHPCPLTPFVKLATGASGIGFGATIGLALGASNAYPNNTPKVHLIEGEGGLTAGRCSEAMAIASHSGIDNLIVHLDWNQASIDSNKVTAENGETGDYVSWQPSELFYINGFNVIEVKEGLNFEHIYAAQKFANELQNGQPTAIIYKTIKGWNYGLEGKASHGSGHKLCSNEFYQAMTEFEQTFNETLPRLCEGITPEQCFYNSLLTIRKVISKDKEIFSFLAKQIKNSKQNLALSLRIKKPININKVYEDFIPELIPEQFSFGTDKNPTLRGTCTEVLNYINKATNGTFMVATADLSGSTGAGKIANDFPKGFYNKYKNSESKIIANGGITEDGLGAVMSGISAYGEQIGIVASYGAFTSAMIHTTARLHAIGQQCYQEATGKKKNTFVIFTGHAGLPTGPDGPTHADPQMLQLIANNFPKGASITLTPLDANDMWPALTSALNKRPAVLYPIVTRPNVKIINRENLGVDKAENAKNGVYSLSHYEDAQGAIIIQGSGVGEIFTQEVLPILKEKDIKLNVYYIVSPELFDSLSDDKQERILPTIDMYQAIGITDFTLPTITRWIKSKKGVELSLHPFKKGKYLASGQAKDVYKEAGLDAQSQLAHIYNYLEELKHWY